MSAIQSTESAILKKLSSLNGTQTSIQNTSEFILNYTGDPKKIAKLWYREYKKAGIKQKVVLLYLANDVIQNGRKKCPAYLTLFQGALPSAFNEAAKLGDAKVAETLHRLLAIWQERSIYPKDFLFAIKRNVTKHQQTKSSSTTTTTAVADTTNIIDSATSNKHSSSSNLPPATASSSSNNNSNTPTNKQHRHRHHHRSPKSPKAENDPVYMESTSNHSTTISSSATTSQINDNNSSSQNSNAQQVQKLRATLKMEIQKDRNKPTTTADLLASFEELQSPPSADAFVRETIAKFPPEVSSVTSAQRVKSKKEAQAYLELVRESANIVSEYNKRLEDEIQLRRKLAASLRNYLTNQRDFIRETDSKIDDCNQKLQKATLLRDKCLSHVDNLPDLPSLVLQPEDLVPLPSVKDLFD